MINNYRVNLLVSRDNIFGATIITLDQRFSHSTEIHPGSRPP